MEMVALVLPVDQALVVEFLTYLKIEFSYLVYEKNKSYLVMTICYKLINFIIL
jgi:hypothetical protein